MRKNPENYGKRWKKMEYPVFRNLLFSEDLDKHVLRWPQKIIVYLQIPKTATKSPQQTQVPSERIPLATNCDHMVSVCGFICLDSFSGKCYSGISGKSRKQGSSTCQLNQLTQLNQLNLQHTSGGAISRKNWKMLKDVERCWKMLKDVERCWKMLKDVERWFLPSGTNGTFCTSGMNWDNLAWRSAEVSTTKLHHRCQE